MDNTETKNGIYKYYKVGNAEYLCVRNANVVCTVVNDGTREYVVWLYIGCKVFFQI